MPRRNAYDKKKKNSYIALFTDEDNGKNKSGRSYLYEDDLVVRTFTNNSGRTRRDDQAGFNPDRMQIYEVTQFLNTDIEQGLGRRQILSSYARNGKNNVFPEYKRGFADSFKSQILGISPVIYALAGVLIYIFNGNLPYLISALAMAVLLTVNSFISVYASKCFKEVNKKAALRTTVVRQGKIFTIDSSALVPGDIVMLQSGSVVPADIRLCEANMLYALETPITGAEESVLKDPLYIHNGVGRGTSDNMVYAGTIIRSGKGTGIVCFTSENVRIRKMKRGSRFELLPDLIRYPSELNGRAAVFASILCFVFLFAGLLFKRDLITLFMTGAALCASLLFEITSALSTLSFGTKLKKTLEKGAAVKNLNCIGDLCSVDSIMCGKQSAFPVVSANVKSVFADNTESDPLNGGSQTVRKLMTYAVVCSDVKRKISKNVNSKELIYFGTHTEMAVVNVCKKLEIDIEQIKKSYFRIETENSRSTDTYKTLALHDNRNIYIVKGSPEYVISYCSKYEKNGVVTAFDAKAKKAILNIAERMTNDSQIVMAIASSFTNAERLNDPTISRDLVFNGFIGVYTSYDVDAAAAVGNCADAGIETVLKTPDDYNTAVKMAKDSGIIKSADSVVSSKDIAEMGYDCYKNNVMFYNLYLHPTDEQWLQTLKLRKAAGKKVLFTGEDIDELRMMNAADVSTSLSSENNDTLRQSADIILQSGGIKVISETIRYARSLYESVHTLCSHAVSLFALFMTSYIVSVCFGLPFDLALDRLIPAVSFTFLIAMIPVCLRGPAKNSQGQKPEAFSKRFRTDEYIFPVIYGILNALAIRAVYSLAERFGTEAEAVSAAYIALTVSILLLSAMRSYLRPVFRSSNVNKTVFPVSVIAAAGLTAMLISVPKISAIFGLTIPGAASIAVSVSFPAALFVLYQVFVTVFKPESLKGKREKSNKKILKQKKENQK